MNKYMMYALAIMVVGAGVVCVKCIGRGLDSGRKAEMRRILRNPSLTSSQLRDLMREVDAAGGAQEGWMKDLRHRMRLAELKEQQVALLQQDAEVAAELARIEAEMVREAGEMGQSTGAPQ